MKKLLKITAILLAVVLLIPVFAGCHEKDEIAYTIGEHKFTSAMYSCVLYISASEARSKISDYLTAKEQSTEKINYKQYKFDAEGNVSETGTISYNDHVKTTAVNVLRQYAVLLDYMKAENLKLDDDTNTTAKINAEYYWYAGCDYSTYQYYTAYGADISQYFTPYSEFLEPNGVALSTYEYYLTLDYTYDFYFKHLYDEGGAKAVDKATLTEYMTKHYALGDVISLTTADSSGKDLSAEDKAEVKANADAYAQRITNGESFADVYKAYEDSLKTEEQKKEESKNAESASDTASTDKTEEEKEYTPESYKTLFGDEESTSESNLFPAVSAMSVGEVKVLEDTEQKCYVVVVRRDITEQDYWLKTLKSSILYALKQDEFNADLDKAGSALTATEDKHATRPFSVEDIKF